MPPTPAILRTSMTATVWIARSTVLLLGSLGAFLQSTPYLIRSSNSVVKSARIVRFLWV